MRSLLRLYNGLLAVLEAASCAGILRVRLDPQVHTSFATAGSRRLAVRTPSRRLDPPVPGPCSPSWNVLVLAPVIRSGRPDTSRDRQGF